LLLRKIDKAFRRNRGFDAKKADSKYGTGSITFFAIVVSLTCTANLYATVFMCNPLMIFPSAKRRKSQIDVLPMNGLRRNDDAMENLGSYYHLYLSQDRVLVQKKAAFRRL
jgi:hypothetical protein